MCFVNKHYYLGKYLDVIINGILEGWESAFYKRDYNTKHIVVELLCFSYNIMKTVTLFQHSLKKDVLLCNKCQSSILILNKS